jgi:hypothetical protein
VSELETAIVLANKILDRINADPDHDLAILARQFLRSRERELSVYTRAIRLASDGNQTVGEKHDYYVTIQQLENLVTYGLRAEMNLDVRRMVRPGDEPLA